MPRVGLPPELAHQPGGTGHTNMWRHVVGRLEKMTDMVLVPPTAHARGVDVWLGDGHQGPLPVDRPQLLQIHEAGWHTEELRQVFGREFLDHLNRHIGAVAASDAHIVTPSASAARQICALFDVEEHRVHPVHHGVDHSVFRPGLGGGGALVARAGGRADQPYVLYVGLAHPRKNVEALRTAMEGLVRRGFDHQLVLVLSIPHDRPNGADLVAELGRELPGSPGRVVVLPPPTDAQLAAVIAGADVLCHPSLMEGFGLPALEAMACGTPVVVSNRGALPEVVGDAGVLVEPKPDDIERGLASVLEDSDRSDSFSRAGLRRAADFTWHRAAKGWLSALEAAAHRTSLIEGGMS